MSENGVRELGRPCQCKRPPEIHFPMLAIPFRLSLTARCVNRLGFTLCAKPEFLRLFMSGALPQFVPEHPECVALPAPQGLGTDRVELRHSAKIGEKWLEFRKHGHMLRVDGIEHLFIYAPKTTNGPPYPNRKPPFEIGTTLAPLKRQECPA